MVRDQDEEGRIRERQSCKPRVEIILLQGHTAIKLFCARMHVPFFFAEILTRQHYRWHCLGAGNMGADISSVRGFGHTFDRISALYEIAAHRCDKLTTHTSVTMPMHGLSGSEAHKKDMDEARQSYPQIENERQRASLINQIDSRGQAQIELREYLAR